MSATLLLAHVFTFASNVIPPKLHAVLASATVQADPAQITLTWPADANAVSYKISRKAPQDGGWTPLATLPGSAVSFTDNSVAVGASYEYQLIKLTSANYTGYGYLAAGIEVAPIEQRGTVILVVANTYASDLAAELTQLEEDLVGDGWQVLRHDVSPTDTVEEVKGLIKADYGADPAHVEALFLFGHVPIPYSGAVAPDGHTNHFGAWPADVYYGELQGQWTDSSVTATNAERIRNWNVPGDRKFDQSLPPGRVLLQIGRVDLSNMTCFSNKTPSRSELDLLRQYLTKDHRFRYGLLPVQRRALICDNFSDKGDDPIGCSGWRNFAGFFGADSIVEVGWSNYFPTVTTQSYLWSFASGGGEYYTCTGVGSSDDFALQDIQAVFTMWLGSYFGDWDNESNFLRAPLGSTTYTLTSSFSGFPQWLYHPMALGQTAGYCARLTQNNAPGGLYPPFNQGTNQVHIDLLGDPTLRMHPVLPPSKLSLAPTSNGGVHLTWSASSDTDVRGYSIYRAASSSGPFAPIAQLTATTSLDDTPPAGPSTYMVRTVKLEHSGGGTYLNLSQGIFASASGSSGSSSAATGLQLAIVANGSSLTLQLSGNPGQPFTLEVSQDLLTWTALTTDSIPSGSSQFTTTLLAAGQQQFYRAR